jgi:hypothetical protein
MKDDMARFYILMKALKQTLPSHFGCSDEFSLLNEPNPYRKACNAIKYLDVKVTPNDKFKQISVIKEEICSAVDNYWKKA